MGCKYSRVITANTMETSGRPKKVLTKEEEKAMDIVKNTTEDNPVEEQKKLTELKVLQQLKENNTLNKTYIGTGGVAYNFALNNDHDGMLIRPSCPDRINKRMNKASDEQFSKEEREMMSDIIRADNLESKGQSSRRIAEKQEQARLRREERHRQICEKFERKRKESEERIKKLEAQKKERIEKLTQSILRKKVTRSPHTPLPSNLTCFSNLHMRTRARTTETFT